MAASVAAVTRWLLLLAASYGIYAGIFTAWQREPVLLLLASTLVTYGCALGLGPDKPDRRRLLALGIVFNIGTLFVFKYTDFFLGSLESLFRQFAATRDLDIPALKLMLPVGLSFYTFSAVSYLADVYSGRMEAERHLGRFAVYVAFFPKILAGPIDRAATFLPQLRDRYRFDAAKVTEGLQLLLWGLFKKFVIADRLAVFVDSAYAAPAFAPALSLVIAAYFYAFQIYCDFSGYTDIARGTAKILGIDLMENFRRAYLSRSPAEFWGRRWHLSLATWFRDYLYIPMGGSRASVPRRYVNLMAVFAVSGLWHGANWTFVVWGCLNGLYVCAGTVTGKLWRRLGERLPAISGSMLWSALRVLFTFHLITFAWIFFRATSLQDAWTIISRICASWSLLPTMVRAYAWPPEMGLALALIAFLIVFELFDEGKPVWDRLRTKPVAVRWSFYYALLFGLVILGKWELTQFIYMQF
jgi:alginate O-acetyltransferase complex protein AlgI